MNNVITYRKPSARDRAAMAGGGATKITSHAYKGFEIVKCLAGGYRVEYNGRAIEPVVSLKAGKGRVDKLSKLVH